MPRRISREAISAFYDHQVGVTRRVDADIYLPLTIVKEGEVSVVRVRANYLKLPYRKLSVHGFTVFAIHDPVLITPP